MRSGVRRLERLFIAVNAGLMIVILSAMAVIVGTNVGLRYFTTQSLPWADEAARYLMIWMTFLGAGLVLRIGGHVAITNLQDALPGPGQRLLRAAIVLLLLGFFVFMMQVGWQYAQRMQFQVTPALRLPFSYIYAAMPAGFALLILHLLLIAKPYICAGRYRPLTDSAAALPGAANG